MCLRSWRRWRPRQSPWRHLGEADMLGIQVTDTWAHTKASRTRDTDDGVYGTPVRSVNRSPCARKHPRATRHASPATLRRRVASSASVALVMPPTARDPYHRANDEDAGPGSPITRAAGQMTTGAQPDGPLLRR